MNVSTHDKSKYALALSFQTTTLSIVYKSEKTSQYLYARKRNKKSYIKNDANFIFWETGMIIHRKNKKMSKIPSSVTNSLRFSITTFY